MIPYIDKELIHVHVILSERIHGIYIYVHIYKYMLKITRHRVYITCVLSTIDHLRPIRAFHHVNIYCAQLENFLLKL